MARLKGAQRERKKKEGNHIIYTQGDDSDSFSSSDDERLDAVQDAWRREQAEDAERRSLDAREKGPARMAVRDWKRKQGAKYQKGKRVIGNRAREEEEPQGALREPVAS